MPVEPVLAVAFVASGSPEHGGRVFAAEARLVGLAGTTEAFQREWVEGVPCPVELSELAGGRKGDGRVADQETLAGRILDWLDGRPCWSLDHDAVEGWLSHWAERLKRPAPTVLDVVLLAQVLALVPDTSTAHDVMKTFGGKSRAERPAGSLRAEDVVACLEGIAAAFHARVPTHSNWVRLVCGHLLRTTDSTSHAGAFASASRTLLLQSQETLLAGKLLPPLELAPVHAEDVEALIVAALSDPGPTYLTGLGGEGRPAASANSGVSPEQLRQAVSEIFRLYVPQHFQKEEPVYGDSRADKSPEATAGEPAEAQAELFEDEPTLRPPEEGEATAARPGRKKPVVESAFRPGQLEMALAVSDALVQERVLLAEAETGTGKTLAYLVPAALASISTGRKVYVSTYTRALQDQVGGRDLEVLQEVLRSSALAPRPVRVATVKGANNYLCVPAFADAVLDSVRSSAERLATTALISTFLFGTDGTCPERDAFPTTIAGALSRLIGQSRSVGRCRKHRSSGGLPRCPHVVAHDASRGADIVVVNHAWLLSNSLDSVGGLIVDEADLLPKTAESKFAQRVALRELRRLLDEITAKDSGILSRWERLAGEDDETARDHSQTLMGLVAAIRDALASIEPALTDWSKPGAQGQGEWEFLPIHRGDPPGEHLVAALANVQHELARLPQPLQALTDTLPNLRIRGPQHRTRRALERQLHESLDAVQQVIGALAPWVADEPPDDYVLLLRQDIAGWALNAEPLLLGPLLAERLKSAKGLVCCSASMSVGGDFDLFSMRTGIDVLTEGHAPPIHLRVPSPFDYARAMVVGVAVDAPSPSQTKAPDRERWLAEAIAFTAVRTRGRLLCLFTSIEEMRRVAEAVGPVLTASGIPLYVGTGENADAVAHRFRTEVHSVAFGVKTFWYGVDFPGETLEWVFIARLPYAVPSLLERRREDALCSKYDLNAWDDYKNPSALLQVKQGLGRLIRRASDKGTVIILDPRVHPRLTELTRKVLPVGADSKTGGLSEVELRLTSLPTLLEEAFERHGLTKDIKARGLPVTFRERALPSPGPAAPPESGPVPTITGPVMPVPSDTLPSDADLDLIGEQLTRGELAQAWNGVEPHIEEATRHIAEDPRAGRLLILAARIRNDEGRTKEALGFLDAFDGIPVGDDRIAAERLRLHIITGSESPVGFWRERPVAQEVANAVLERRPLLVVEEDPEMAGYHAVASYELDRLPLDFQMISRAWEGNPSFRLPAYVSGLHALRAGKVAAENQAKLATVVREGAGRFDLPVADLSAILPVLAQEVTDSSLHQLGRGLLETADLDAIGGLAVPSVLQFGEMAALLESYPAVEKVTEELDSMADAGVLTPEQVTGAMLLFGERIRLALTRSTEAIRSGLPATISFAFRYELGDRGARALEPLLQREGVDSRLHVEAEVAKALLLASAGRAGEATSLLVDRAAKERAAERFDSAARLLEQAWLVADEPTRVSAEDDLLRRCQPTLAPVATRAAQPVEWLDGRQAIVVGGDPGLKNRVMEHLPAGANVRWFLCERGHRPNFDALDSVLTAGQFDRLVLVTHHVSHALSGHVRKWASTVAPNVLALPQLPGMTGVLSALRAGTWRIQREPVVAIGPTKPNPSP